MRALWLVLLMFAAPAQALLEDGTGDVALSHCQAAESPAAGFDAMDLLGLNVTETPAEIVFTVSAVGLSEEASHDAGNYFVYFQRGQQHYALRMFQDNQGSGALAQLLRTEGVTPFGQTIAQAVADVDGNTMSTAVQREWLLDHDGALPVRGHTMDNVLVSAEAHATGIYACSFDGSGGGPAIVEDRMPDDFSQGATVTFAYGGGEAQGPVELSVQRPFRASNGEATTYRYNVTVRNLDGVGQGYSVEHEGMPADWQLVRPNGTLHVRAGEEARFDVLLVVPFRHVHGETMQFDLVVAARDGSARAEAQIGVHYLEVAQPSGHHPVSYLHSLSSLGPFSAFSAAAGGGDHHLYWNTLEEDDGDHMLPVSAQYVDGVHTWYACLAPRLALGLRPDNATGAFELSFASDVAVSGDLGLTITHIKQERGPTCQYARSWPEGQPIVQSPPLPISVDGEATATGTLNVAFTNDIPYEPGTDLLLTIRLRPDQSSVVGGVVDLLPGGWMQLPLQDHHEVPDVELGPTQGPFVEEQQPRAKGSPLPLALAVVALAVAGRRR